MITTFVKGHSRAAYLDRCIRSIERNVLGHGPIVLLNDGLPRKYLDRLLVLHPALQVRNSFKVTDPPARPEERSAPAYDPARFWTREIGRDTGDYVIVMEEDSWFTHGFDLPLVVRNLAANNAMMLRFAWNSSAILAAENETIFTAVLGADCAIRYYSPTIKSQAEAYKIFSFAHAIFRRDYWVACYEPAPNWMAEREVLKHALMHLQRRQALGEQPRFCDFGREVVRVSFGSTSREDGGGFGVKHRIDPAPYNAALDDAWLKGELDPMADYPADFGDATRLKVFGGALTQGQIDDWVQWRADYVAMYRRMGCDVA